MIPFGYYGAAEGRSRYSHNLRYLDAGENASGHWFVSPGGFFTELTPYSRVGTAIAPFLVALGIRVLFGKSRVTHALLSLATTWFAANVLMAPFSLGLREELLNLGRWLR